MTLTDLAEAVNVSADDVRVVLGWLGADEEDDSPDVITAVHMILNPNSERTVPELYYPELGSDWRE